MSADFDSGGQNKATTQCKTRIWCDKCRAEIDIITPNDKEVKYCPCCRGEIIRESIQYV